MLGIVAYPAFLVSSILLNMTPGADTIYVLSRSAVGGRKAGIVSALGISSGVLVHTTLAAFGLSILLAQSALAFNAVKLAGALYLIVMGVRTMLSHESLFRFDGSSEGGESLWKVYRQGVLTNALNPKVALFFLALLPQFVDPNNPYGPLPFLLLGLSFFCTNTVWLSFLAFISSFFSLLLQKSPMAQTVATKASGCIYILLGLNVLRAKMAA